MPFNSSTPILYYNKDMFETRGWELPRTTNELIVLADKVKDAGLIAFANESQTGYIGYLAGFCSSNTFSRSYSHSIP